MREYLVNLEDPCISLIIKIFGLFASQNKVLFLCNYNFLRKKAQKTLQKYQYKRYKDIEVGSLDFEVIQLYLQIYVKNYLLWADSSLLDQDLQDNKILIFQYERYFFQLMNEIKSNLRNDIDRFSLLVQSNHYPPVITKAYLFFLSNKFQLLHDNMIDIIKLLTNKYIFFCMTQKNQLKMLNILGQSQNPLKLISTKEYNVHKIFKIFEANNVFEIQKRGILNYLINNIETSL